MSPRYVHITATEARTLCGLLADGGNSHHFPWREWIEQYQAQPSSACPKCKRIAHQYADRHRAIRDADIARMTLSPDEHPEA